jgi:hypothetical protein
VLTNPWINEFAPMCLELGKRAFLVDGHETTESGDICRQNGSQTPSHALEADVGLTKVVPFLVEDELLGRRDLFQGQELGCPHGRGRPPDHWSEPGLVRSGRQGPDRHSEGEIRRPGAQWRLEVGLLIFQLLCGVRPACGLFAADRRSHGRAGARRCRTRAIAQSMLRAAS